MKQRKRKLVLENLLAQLRSDLSETLEVKITIQVLYHMMKVGDEHRLRYASESASYHISNVG